MILNFIFIIFFFNATATTEIYTLSLHDALPICNRQRQRRHSCAGRWPRLFPEQIQSRIGAGESARSEEHTSELQSRENLVCRLLLEKKKKEYIKNNIKISIIFNI